MKYTVQVMTTHRGMRIIHKGKNTDWTDGLYHLVMDYFDKKMKLYDTMARLKFNNACKKINMIKNDDTAKFFLNK